MKLTSENKATIDALAHQELIVRWVYAPPSDVWFQDETGQYWSERVNEIRDDVIDREKGGANDR